MHNMTWRAAAAIVSGALTSTLIAQAPAASSRQAATSHANGQVVLTGCIVQESTRAQNGGAAGLTFLLTNAVKSPEGPTGTSGPAAAASTADTFRLDTDGSKVSAHVGHRVEVTGTVEPPTGLALPATEATDAPRGIAPRVKVASVRMIAATCP